MFRCCSISSVFSLLFGVCRTMPTVFVVITRQVSIVNVVCLCTMIDHGRWPLEPMCLSAKVCLPLFRSSLSRIHSFRQHNLHLSKSYARIANFRKVSGCKHIACETIPSKTTILFDHYSDKYSHASHNDLHACSCL